MVSELEDICESLHILLSTRPGERIMRPEYGCNLDYLQFEPLNETLYAFVRQMITNAILYFEPRIDLERIEFDLAQELEGVLNIELSIVVRSTNSRFNFVYPFYLEEAERIERQQLGGGPMDSVI